MIQESEIRDSRGGAFFDRLDRIMKLFPNHEELKRSVLLVFTKTRGDFSPQELLENAAREKENMLLRFFVNSPEKVFSFPSPSIQDNGKIYSLFAEKDRLIQSLQIDPVINPHHSIDLDPTSILYVLALQKRFGNIKDLILKFTINLQGEYRSKDLSVLEQWEGSVANFLSLRDEDINTPEKLASGFQKYFSWYSGKPPLEILDQIKSNGRIYSFCSKINPQGSTKKEIELLNIPKILRPLLQNINEELKELILHKKAIEEQKRRAAKLAADLESQRAIAAAENRRREEKEAIEKVFKQKYAFLSRSSGRYLDGREGQLDPYMTARNPVGDRWLNWYITPTGDGFYSFRSESSGRHLDGREGQLDPYMTARNPIGDRWLNWSIERMDDGFYALRSRSSGRYLDGRGGQLEPYMTARNPRGDYFLNWSIVPTELGAIPFRI